MKYLYFFLVLFLANSLHAATMKDSINIIQETVLKLCHSPSESNKFFEVKGAGGAKVGIKFIDAEIEGELTKSEWEGAQKVLKEHQHNENKDFRVCSKELTPVFIEMMLRDMLEKDSVGIKNEKNKSCNLEDFDYSNPEDVKKSIRCLSKKKSPFNFDLGKDVQTKNGISVKFKGCERSEDSKHYYCSLILMSERDVKVTIYNDLSDYAPTYFTEDLESRGSQLIYIKESNYNNNSVGYPLQSGIPVQIYFRHTLVKGNLNSYFFILGADGENYKFKFSASSK